MNLRPVMVMQQEWEHASPPVHFGRYVNRGELKGKFHGIFNYTDEDNRNFPVAVVEYEDGRLEEVCVNRVRFI